MVKSLFGLLLTHLVVGAARVPARPPGESHTYEPTLARGICVDRQVRRIPPEIGMRVDRDDIRLIKSMGFGFVKLLLNPAVLKSGSALDVSSMAFFDQVIDSVAILAAGSRLEPTNDRCMLDDAGFVTNELIVRHRQAARSSALPMVKLNV